VGDLPETVESSEKEALDMAWSWQKTDQQGKPPSAAPPDAPRPAAAAPKKRETTKMEKIVNIGQSVQIKGELTGNEDLTIEGMVDGKILVKDHNLTIGTNGKITAEVHAKTVVVVGQVMGNITADDKVEIAPSGSVEGDIRAPRVAISDGARFKGSIDMEKKGGAAAVKSGVGTSTTSASISKEIVRSAAAAEG
jgi:cytoskeletal protein CcmA (bactofilin family)